MSINTDGLVVIGPGSEWLWTAVSGLVLAITFVAIYRQLRLQRSGMAFEQIASIVADWSSERMTRHTLELCLAIKGGAALDALPYGAASVVGNYWETVAALVHAGHIDRKIVRETLGIPCRWWWAALRPWAERSRVESVDTRILDQFEWLASTLEAMDRRDGRLIAYDENHLGRTVDRRIENDRDRLRIAEDLRTVIVRSPAEPVGGREREAPRRPRRRAATAESGTAT
jgi:hypothetical protein